MSKPEFLAWGEFYRLYPFDDYHRFFRPAALVAGAFGGGGTEALNQRLDWLQPPPDDGYSLADRNTFKALGMPNPPRR